MTEAQLEKKLVTFCREHGLLTYKFASPSHRGVPDRIIMGRGRVLFVELKRPGNVPTELQLREIDRIKATGNGAFWSSDFLELSGFLIRFFGLSSGDPVDVTYTLRTPDRDVLGTRLLGPLVTVSHQRTDHDGI